MSKMCAILNWKSIAHYTRFTVSIYDQESDVSCCFTVVIVQTLNETYLK